MGRGDGRFLKAGAALLGTLLCAGGAGAQQADTVPPAPATVPRSLGQPPVWQGYLGAYRAAGGSSATPVVAVYGGAYRAYRGAVSGVFGVSVEPLLTVSPEVHPGVRALFTSRAVSLSAGVQFVEGRNQLESIFSWNTAILRGGVLGHGSMLRVDWTPHGTHRLAAGFQVPLHPLAGHTRPRRTGVSLPSAKSAPPAPMLPIPEAADSALRAMKVAGADVERFSNAYPTVANGPLRRSLDRFRARVRALRDTITAARPGFPNGVTYEAAEASYHAALDAAFTAVTPAGMAAEVARVARREVLHQVILPVNALFGQVKEGHTRLDGLRANADAGFARWLADSSGIPEVDWPAIQQVNRAYGDLVEEAYRRRMRNGARSRALWLPPQLALRPEDHDEQGEIDALIERATDAVFTEENRITYLRSADVQYEFLRTIRAARDYHVLWLHDFMGRNRGEYDAVGFALTVNGYLAALTDAVRAYDRTHHLPQYFIFLDQHFYDLRDGRLWMTLLEDPLGASRNLLASDSALSRQLGDQLTALQRAVEGSRDLQAEASKRGGSSWVRRQVKVHVSVTLPSDFSFRSKHIVPGVPLVPDNIVRDHRKMAFYDLREDDPNRGELVIAGAGIGEQYASGTWDDRALLLRGPAAIRAKVAARDLLRAHGLRADELPEVLGVSAGADALASLGGDPRNVATVAQLHNTPGFGTKSSTVARAMLYSLMPRGSMMVVPDPLWLSSEWAGMLVGAAMRGAEVYVVAPSILNAPSAGLPQVSTTHDLLAHLLVLGEEMRTVMEGAGGALHIGIFTAKEDVNDVRAQIAEISSGLRRSRIARQAFPFPAALVAATDSLPTMLELPTYAPEALAEDALLRLPQLHQKTQFFATREAIGRLVMLPEWRDIFLRVFATRIRQASAVRDTAGAEVAARAYMGVGLTMIEKYRSAIPEPGKDIFYLSLGSQNQDPRGMWLDGEATLLVSGVGAVVAVPDFFYLLARSTWVTRLDQLRRFYPPVDNLRRRLGRMIRYAL
ncbi:MAG: hypothetical protein JNL26_07735 [Gemmatimonadetes bacterium]|nr:hypothetical protein [Gemmatimonadota bacterium]